MGDEVVPLALEPLPLPFHRAKYLKVRIGKSLLASRLPRKVGRLSGGPQPCAYAADANDAGRDDRSECEYDSVHPTTLWANQIADGSGGRSVRKRTLIAMGVRPGLKICFRDGVIDQDRTPLYVRERSFVLHQDREDIAADRMCNATRVRSYVTLPGVRAQMSEVVCTYIGSVW